jgi:hypothetical protein
MSRNLDTVLIRLILSFCLMATALTALLAPQLREPALITAAFILMLRVAISRY